MTNVLSKSKIRPRTPLAQSVSKSISQTARTRMQGAASGERTLRTAMLSLLKNQGNYTTYSSATAVAPLRAT